MSAVMSTDERYAASMARMQQRVASISTSVPDVIEAISSQAFAAATAPKQAVRGPAETVDTNPLPTKDAQMAGLSAIGLLGMKTRADDVLLVIAFPILVTGLLDAPSTVRSPSRAATRRPRPHRSRSRLPALVS